MWVGLAGLTGLEKLMMPLDPPIRIFASTGNHDLNYFFGKDPDERPWTWFGLFPVTGLDAEPRISGRQSSRLIICPA
jgi:hypothetical protein